MCAFLKNRNRPMSQSLSSKRDTICPDCGRALSAHDVCAHTREAISNRHAAIEALPYGSPQHIRLLAEQAGAIARILVTRKRAAMAAGDRAPIDRKKFH
jgi:hypothetical protein